MAMVAMGRFHERRMLSATAMRMGLAAWCCRFHLIEEFFQVGNGHAAGATGATDTGDVAGAQAVFGHPRPQARRKIAHAGGLGGNR